MHPSVAEHPPNIVDYGSDSKTMPTVGASEVNDAKDLNLNLGADGNAERDRADLQPDAGDCLETPPTIPQGPHPKFPFAFRGKNEFDLQGDNSKQRGQIRKATSDSRDTTQAAATTSTTTDNPTQTVGSANGEQKPRRALK